MQFSDTSNKSGLIQECEFWTNLGDAGISGDTFLLKQFTNRINRAFDMVLPIMLSISDKLRWDDSNHTDSPVATTNIVSGQNDYPTVTDEDGNSILNVADVMFLEGSTATEYRRLRRITLDEPDALRAMSPNPTDTGIPSAFLEKDNVIYLLPSPSYSATAGLKIFFDRTPSYFASSDTTKKAGIPAHFHLLLALYASLDYLLVHKPDNSMLITRVEARIAKCERDLGRSISQRNPLRRRIVGARTNAE